MKKKTKSIQNILFRKSESELIQLLQESLSRVSQLEARNKQLQRELNKFKTVAAKERQRAASLRGQLTAEQERVQTLQKSLRIARKSNKVAKQKVQAIEAENKAIKEIIKQIKPTLSKEQVFEMYRNSNLNRFWARVTEVQAIDEEKLVEMRNKMASWTSQKLRDAVRVAGWRSTWYDSDAEWNSSELSGWDERNIYAFIMSF